MSKRKKSSEDELDNSEFKRAKKINWSESCKEIIRALKSYNSEDGRNLLNVVNHVHKNLSSSSALSISTNNETGYLEQETESRIHLNFDQIIEKIKSEEYTDIEKLSEDIELIITDVKDSFKEEEKEFKDANELYEFFLDVKQDALSFEEQKDEPQQQLQQQQQHQLQQQQQQDKQQPIINETKDNLLKEEEKLEEEEEVTIKEEEQEELKEEEISLNVAENEQFSNSESVEMNLDNLDNYEHEATLDELIQTINDLKDNDGRKLSILFQILPPKSKFKDYYEMINNPIDLKTIEGKNRNNEYRNLNELEKDLLLMVRNAKTYNKPGSQIYKDANSLKKLIVAKKIELEQRKCQPLKKSNRIKAKQTTGGSSSSTSKFNKSFDDSPNASLNHEDSLADDPNDSGPDEDDPMYKLYDFVVNYKNSSDVRLSDPFMRLPNRRFYPDYYDEIKRPTALSKIKSKIRTNQYSNLNEMLDELNIMFKNALKYNLSHSQIYKDAQELQKYCFQKAKEYTDYVPVDDLSSIESEEEEEKEEEEADEDEEDEEQEVLYRPIRNKKTSTVNRSKKPTTTQTLSTYETSSSSKSNNNKLNKSQTGGNEVDVLMRRRFKQLYKTLINYSDEENRYPIDLFMEKPSRKDYPDYYEFIKDPIDMKTIDANIKSDKYSCEEELLKDFKLMFDNCREYNEDGSQIYIDADTLEEVLFKKINELDSSISGKAKKLKQMKANNSAYERIKQLFENVIGYKDTNGRQLSKLFMKLPSKSDYPAYYEIIKRPIDLDKIGMRIKTGVYESLDDILSDLILSFDNACKFNEPDSQIYKDALALQNFAIQNKLELVELNTDGIPDVKQLVQDLLTNLFTSVYGHIDEEGRCYSESLLEIIEHNLKKEPVEQQQQQTSSLSIDQQQQHQQQQQIQLKEDEDLSTFDLIKNCLQKNKFRRLDRFQSDMFTIFEKVRKTSRTDSQAFEDSIEMQLFFIRLRNELCKNGERLQSPALNYTEADLNASVENLKKEKLPYEHEDEKLIDDKDQQQQSSSSSLQLENQNSIIEVQDLEEIMFNDIQFKIGDYVYVEPKEKNLEPHIIHIQRIYKDEKGEINVYGCWFYRPNETFHLTSKLFLEKEVFKSDNMNSMLLSQVIGKCCVMFIKDYFKSRPIGFNERDIFVCESKYFTKIKQFKKIKYQDWNLNPNFKLEPREEELTMIRVPSVFKNKQQDRSTDEMEVDEDDYSNLSILDIQRLNVKCDAPEDTNFKEEDGYTFYEQFVNSNISIKQDDYCFIEQDNKLNIYQIDKIFVNNDGTPFIQGPLMFRQKDVDNSLRQQTPFYEQEIFLTTKMSIHSIDKIKSKCSVLSYKDYITKRPTEIPEKDVYLCESKYCLDTKNLVKLPGGLPKRQLRNPNIVNDEFYGFRKALQLIKKEVEIETKPSLLSSIVKKNPNLNFDIAPSSPMSTSTILPSSENEESNDNLISNFGLNNNNNDSQQSFISTPISNLKKNKIPRKIITGYILFASETRKTVCLKNPDCNFGEISRIIGQEWKRLPIENRQEYERKAAKQNESTKAEAKEQAKLLAESMELYPGSPSTSNENQIYECLWGKECDYQFEDPQDLLEHLTLEPNGHVQRKFGHLQGKDGCVFPCCIRNCSRFKKGGALFHSLHKLIRHLREIHVNKQQPKYVLPENRSRNYIPKKGSMGSNNYSQISMFDSRSATSLVIQQPCQNQMNQISMYPSPNYNDGLNSSINQMNPISSNLSPNYITNYSTQPHQQTINQQSYQQQQPHQTIISQPSKPVEHLFVQPPRPNRILYTDTYIKYIERLKPEQKHITNWESQLNATQENTVNNDHRKLPTNWLQNKETNHENLVGALWSLRQLMMEDCLKINRHHHN